MLAIKYCGVSLILLNVCALLVTLTQGAGRGSRFKQIQGIKKSADILDAMQVKSAGECAVRCIARYNCDSYNIAQSNGESNTRACELVKGGNNTMTSAAPDWDMFVGKRIALKAL